MSRIHKGQNKLRITLFVGDDLSGVTSQKIMFRKPNGFEGSFAALQDAANESIYYEVVDINEIDQEGPWTFWAELTYNDGRIAYGDPDSQVIYTPGKQ